MSRNVLILCTGNSCRSIIAEALINKNINNIKAYSSGVNASGTINSNAIKVLKKNNCWNDAYHSKKIDEILHITFDLVVTVCENANQSCPTFPKQTKVLHISFNDPDKKEYIEFEKTYKEIYNKLLPIVNNYFE